MNQSLACETPSPAVEASYGPRAGGAQGAPGVLTVTAKKQSPLWRPHQGPEDKRTAWDSPPGVRASDLKRVVKLFDVISKSGLTW